MTLIRNVCRTVSSITVSLDPWDPAHQRVLEIPFCAMNTIHREKIEKASALPDIKDTPSEVVVKEIESYVNVLEDAP